MMKKIEEMNYYELLEVSPSATAQDIHRAYERIRRVYEPNSIALYSLFSAEETDAIHQRIEEAYRTLIYEDNRKNYDALLRERKELPEPEPLAPPMHARQYQPAQSMPLFPTENHLTAGADTQPDPAPPQPAQEETSPVSQFIGEFTGPAIKALREQRGQTVRAIADLTKVGVRYLEYIEEESFEKLPVRTYLRGFLILYAKALGCDPERMSNDYLKRFEAAVKK